MSSGSSVFSIIPPKRARIERFILVQTPISLILRQRSVKSKNYDSRHLQRFDVRHIRSGGFNSGKLSLEYKPSRVFFVGAALRGRPRLGTGSKFHGLGNGEHELNRGRPRRAAPTVRSVSAQCLGGIACPASEFYQGRDNTCPMRRLKSQNSLSRPKRVRRLQ